MASSMTAHFLMPCSVISIVRILLVLPVFYCSTNCMAESTSNALGNDSCSILCSGDIFQQVQMARIFNSSKYFVDMKLLGDPMLIQEEFDKLLNRTTHLKPSDLRTFLDKWFGPPGSDMETLDPPDWKEHPRFIYGVYDKRLRHWLHELNEIWKRLFRRTPEDVRVNAASYSQIYLPNPFIIPGGRFREVYYWDTYWIVEGLLLCEMHTTAKNMIKNLLHLLKTYGFIPNGSRKYYLGRSQAPFLIPMMNLYQEYTGDFQFIEDNISLLDEEYEYWMNRNLVSVENKGLNYSIFHYAINSSKPRPESYYEDFTSFQMVSDDEAEHFFGDLQAGAESGWDFSSRWFITDNGSRSNNLEDIDTQIIAPVDLNSLMCYNAKILAGFYEKIGNKTRHEYYSRWANTMNHTISRIFWDDTEGFWFDYNLETNKLEKGFYGSSFMPLWTQSYGIEKSPSYVIDKVVEYLYSHNLTSFPGGLPTSLVNSSQQWDYPNGWAPLHYIAVLGLRAASVHNSTAGELAEQLAAKWVLNNYFSYMNSGPPHLMMEKYDVTQVGVPGSGGEYPVQDGFGWTNGVVMKLLNTYPHQILISHEHSYLPIYVAVLFGLVAVITLSLYGHRMYCSGDRRGRAQMIERISLM